VEFLGIHRNCDNSCNVDDVDGNNPVKEVGETMIFDTILDEPTSLEVSAYLAHKWGIDKDGCLMVGKKEEIDDRDNSK
jgi:hypothetical protein